MNLGAFSVSLTVKDLPASIAFYEKLGFSTAMDASAGWVIMKNGQTVLGLFAGFIERNTLTFNPGWDQDAQELDGFTDVRDLQKALKAKGIDFVEEADEQGSGPGFFVITDPDGNPILVDQHR
ncbi:MAG: VOC family protein [Rubricella sp.]